MNEVTLPDDIVKDILSVQKFFLQFQVFTDIDNPYPFEVGFEETTIKPTDQNKCQSGKDNWVLSNDIPPPINIIE